MSHWGRLTAIGEGSDWQALIVELTALDIRLPDPNPFPVLRIWRWWK